MGLDATPGGPDANSYLTVDQATAYFAGRTHSSAWGGADPADQERALITATRRLDQEDYRGSKTEYEQALKWPRRGACDSDGFTYDSDEVPRPVKDATCELALLLIESDALKQSKLTNFAHIKIGPLDITPRQPQVSGALPAQVVRLLSHLLMSSRGTIRMVRG